MILNPFRRSKTQPAKSPGPAPAKAPTPPTSATPREILRRERRHTGIIIAPHLTEKSNEASSRNWYTFRVASAASKILVRQAVEERYGVRVERVRILAQRAKKVRLGHIEGLTPGFKKAMVKLVAGARIEFT